MHTALWFVELNFPLSIGAEMPNRDNYSLEHYSIALLQVVGLTCI